MIRRDFFELVDYAIGNADRRQVLHQRHVPRRRRRPAASRRWTTSTSRSASTASTPPPTTRCVATAPTPRPGGRWTTWPTPASGRSRSPSSSPVTTSTSSTSSRRSPTPTARSCGSPACARRAAAPTPGPSCTRPTPSSARSTTGCSSTATPDDRPVLTGDSFFHLNALGEPLPGLNMCGAGRVVCLIDPIGDVYACPFVIHDQFKAGSVRDPGGFAAVWRDSDAVPRAARAGVGRRLRELRQLRRLPGRVHGGQVLHRPAARRSRPGVRQRPRRAGARRRRGRDRRRRARRWTTRGAAPGRPNRCRCSRPPGADRVVGGPDPGRLPRSGRSRAPTWSPRRPASTSPQRLGQPRGVERDAHARVAQGRGRVRPRRPQGRRRRARRAVARRSGRRLRARHGGRRRPRVPGHAAVPGRQGRRHRAAA